MAMYDAGTASLSADGTVTGVGTTWRQPLTLIRVGATMIFNTSPISIVTIAEILSDTSIRAFNDKGFVVPAGSQYFILAHDGITVQGLAQDVAETLRYYQSQETKVSSLVELAESGDFDFDKLQRLVNEAKASETNAASSASAASASQQAAATSQTKAESSASSAQSAYNNTVNVIANAGDAGTLVTLNGYGIAGASSALLGSLDWQQFDFRSSASYRIGFANMTNVPVGLKFATAAPLLLIDVLGIDGNNIRVNVTTSSDTGGNNHRNYEVYISSAKGSRVFVVRELISVKYSQSSDSAPNSANAERYRSLLDVYSKAESDAAVKSISSGGTGATTAAEARTNLDVYSKSEIRFKTFDFVSSVTDSSALDGDYIYVRNISSTSDGGGGLFLFKSSRSMAPDGGIVINTGTSSQIFRDGFFNGGIFKGPVDVAFFGAIPHNDAIDNSIAINLCLDSPYVSEVYIGNYYLVRNKINMKTNKSIVGPSPSWGYADSGFNMVGTIALSDSHELAYLDPILDFRGCRQTGLYNIDVDGRGHDVCCIEYGRRISDTSNTESFNNHVRSNCTFRSARIGLRTDNAGLQKSYGDQITGCTEFGLYSQNNLSDSTIVNLYINEIGYRSENDPSNPFDPVGVGIRLGPHSGVAFIGGKIEYTRVHVQMVGSSYVRFSNMWLDVAKRCAMALIGNEDGYGTNNTLDNCIISGGGYTSADGGAITIDGSGHQMSLVVTGGSIVASNESIDPNATTDPTYGAKLAGLKVGNNPNGLVVLNGVDMRKCSAQFGVYAYGGSKVIDRSFSLLPNSISSQATINGYGYDAGSDYRGLIIKDAGSDSVAASIGVPVGGFYRNNGSNLNIRVS